MLWNQIGNLAYKENLVPVYKAFEISLGNYNDGISKTYSSVLSDWLPRKGKCQGAMSRFCEIAEFDSIRAARDVYMYLSDNWFTDEDDFMLRTTNVSVGLIVPFIKRDASVAFADMAKEIPVIYDLAFSCLTALYEKLIEIIHKSHYLAEIHNLDYTSLENTLFKIYQKSRNARSLEELRLFPPFWANVIGYLKMFSPTGFEEFESVLKVEALEFELTILDHVTGGKAAQYHNSLREYIFTRFLEIGIIPKERERDVKAYLEKVRNNDEYTLAYNRGLICFHNGETEKALEYFNTALQKDGKSAQAFYKRALVNKALNNNKAALSDLKTAVKLYPWLKGVSSADALYVLCLIELGNLCAETNDKKGAIEYYTKVIEREPQNINALIKRGDAYAGTGDYAAAINDFTEVIKIKAACIEAYEKRGAAYEKAGRKEEALKDYASVAFSNGCVFFNNKDYENAINEFQKALSFQNDFEDALLYLAFSYHNNNELDKAFNTYNKLIEEVNPNSYDAWHKRGRLNRYFKKDMDMAFNDFTKAITLRPDLTDALEDRGDLYYDQGKYKEAVDDFTAAINIKPSAVLYCKRGFAYANLSDRDNAIKDYTDAIKSKPDYTDAYLQRGFTYSNMVEYDKAIADFTQMSVLAPNDERSYYYRGLAYSKKWEHKKAIEDYTLAIEKYPEYFDAWLERANSKRLSKDYEGSIQDYDEAIRFNPQHIDARFGKGTAYEELKNYEMAAQTYSEILQILPRDVYALKKRSNCYIKIGQYDNAVNDCRTGIISLFGLVNQEAQTDMMKKGGEAFKAERYDEAIGFFEEAAKNGPANTLAVFDRSLALILLNNYDEAASILLKIQWPDIDRYEDINSAKIFLSGMRFVACSKIIDDCTLLIKNNPADINAYLERGEAYQNMFYPAIFFEESETAYTGAVENYKSALEKEPGNEQIWFGLGIFFEYYSGYHGICSSGWVADLQKEAEKYLILAVENYTKALQLKEDFIEALERRAGVYQKMGLDKKAEADLTAAIEAAKNKEGKNA